MVAGQRGSELSGVQSSGVRRKKRRQYEADEEEWHHQTAIKHRQAKSTGMLSPFLNDHLEVNPLLTVPFLTKWTENF